MPAYTCPCGEAHDPGETASRLIDRFGDTVRVVMNTGAWKVPRIYIAMHGLRGSELPALATRYGWERDDGPSPREGGHQMFSHGRSRGRGGRTNQ